MFLLSGAIQSPTWHRDNLDLWWSGADPYLLALAQSHCSRPNQHLTAIYNTIKHPYLSSRDSFNVSTVSGWLSYLMVTPILMERGTVVLVFPPYECVQAKMDLTLHHALSI
jgi:hypothetical protein